MMDMLITLVVVIILQCMCCTNYHIVHLKYIGFFICQLYLNTAWRANKASNLDFITNSPEAGVMSVLLTA